MSTASIIKVPNACRGDVEISSEFLSQRDELIEKARLVEINDNDSFVVAGDLYNEIARLLASSEKMRLGLQKPFQSVVKKIRECVNSAMTPLAESKISVRTKLNSYTTKLKRREDEERKRVEEEQRKIAEKQIAEAEAESVIFGVDVTPAIEPDHPAPSELIEKPDCRSVVTMERVKFEIVDDDKLPRNWLKVDESKIREFVRESDGLKKTIREHNNEYRYGGVKFYIEQDIRSRKL